MLRIDHAVYAVRDLDEAAERFRREMGLDSSPGGRHPGWGTANRIVPFGTDYIELIAAVDEHEAASSVFGRSVLETTAVADGWLTICVAAQDLDDVAERLRLTIADGRRELPDGRALRWRSAGVDDPRREAWMPFFIQWDVPAELHPGRARAGHGVRAEGIAWVEVAGDSGRLREWLAGEDLPIRVVEGPRGIRAVAIRTAGGELLIR